MAAQERYRIMIVDDDEDLRALMRSALGSKYEVVEAYDGLDALHKLADYQPDLAVIDVEMPLMNGLDLCASIRKHKDFRGIPVLFLSGHGSKEAMKAGYAAGADLFMVKPIDPLRVLKNVDFTIEHDKPPLRSKKNTIQMIHQQEAAGAAGKNSNEDSGITMGDPVLMNPTPPPRDSAAASPRPAAPRPQPEKIREPEPTVPEPSAPEPERPRPVVRRFTSQPGAEAPPAREEAPKQAAFKVNLPPEHPTRSNEVPRPQVTKSGGARPRIMVVDNEEDARQLVDLALRDQFEITSAHDGLDAIEKIVGYQPDLLLVDVMMPRMNGFHLLQSIRRNPNYQHLPVMIITGRASDRDRDYAMKVGANDFMAKPFSTEDLTNRVIALTKLPMFRIAPKKIPIEQIIEREFLIAKERQKDKADQESLNEYKRAAQGVKEVMDDESHRR